MVYIGLFLSTFFFVFLAVFQQQNVIHRHYKSAVVTSMLIAVAQFVMITSVVASDWYGVLAMGFGGAGAVTLSMYSHGRIFKRKEKCQTIPYKH